MDRGRVKPESGLNLRTSPSGDVLSVLRHDEEVELLEAVTYYRVKRENGDIGFAHGDYLEALPNTAPQINDPFTPHDEFQLTNFQHDRFLGEPVRVDQDFIPALNEIAQLAEQHNVKIWVTSSLRSISNNINGAIATPASKSCHHIGHAIDMNIWCEGKLYNSKKLHPAKLSLQPKSVVAFIESIQGSKRLRWGGDFSQVDPVHIDDNFYHTQTLLYKAKLQDRIRKLTT